MGASGHQLLARRSAPARRGATHRFPIAALVALIATIRFANAQECNWGGSSTPADVFAQSCAQAGGVAHGCSCDRPGAGGAPNTYQQQQQELQQLEYQHQIQVHQEQIQQALRAQQEREQQQQEQAREKADRARQAAAAQHAIDVLRQNQFLDDRNALVGNLKGAAAGPSCTVWLLQNDGSYWQQCVYDNGSQHCFRATDNKGSHPKEVSCAS